MIYLLIAISVILIALTLVILTARLVFRVSHQKKETFFSLTVVGCGVVYDLERNLPALLIAKWRYYIKSAGKRKKKKSKERADRQKKAKKRKSRRKLSWETRIKVGRAVLLYGMRFLACLKYDEALLAIRPAIADPALAGMAYGLSSAVYGVFPGLRRTIDIFPDFENRETRWKGYLTFSIKLKQIIYVTCRFLFDLPIKELIGHWWKRGK